MGCDIHLWVERRCTYANEQGVREWERVLPPPTARETPWRVKRGDSSWEMLDAWDLGRYACEWYGTRNYRVFAMLANVRNGSGFAGVKTGDGFTPISEPRGWPHDLSPAVRHLVEGDGCDAHVDGDVFPGDHSESWLTLAELNAYDWQGQTTRCCGVIPFEEFVTRVEHNTTTAPETYCGDTWGLNRVTIEEAEALERMKGGGLAVQTDAVVSVRVWWTVTYAEAACDFYTRVLPALNRLCEPAHTIKQESFLGSPAKEYHYDAVTPDDIRIVFNFDS